MSIIDRLEKIRCGCERADAIAYVDRDTLIAELNKLGFGCGQRAVPSDWRAYYGDDELRGFVLDYAESFSPSA